MASCKRVSLPETTGQGCSAGLMYMLSTTVTVLVKVPWVRRVGGKGVKHKALRDLCDHVRNKTGRVTSTLLVFVFSVQE